MAGEISISGTTRTTGTQQVNYLEQRDVTPLTRKEKESFSDMIKRLYPDTTEDGYSKITDKNGIERTGKVVTTEQMSLMEILKNIKEGKQFELNKPLATVKEAQVNKFLENAKFLGLDLKAEDIMTKNGTLNPNFKVDDKGNICFRNLKAYINGDTPKYFETKDGKWAQEPSLPVTKWTALSDNTKIYDKVRADGTSKTKEYKDKGSDTSAIDPGFSATNVPETNDIDLSRVTTSSAVQSVFQKLVSGIDKVKAQKVNDKGEFILDVDITAPNFVRGNKDLGKVG